MTLAGRFSSDRGRHGPRELVPFSRRKPPKWPQALCVEAVAEEAGEVSITFDNSYSWLQTKVFTYKLELFEVGNFAAALPSGANPRARSASSGGGMGLTSTTSSAADAAALGAPVSASSSVSISSCLIVLCLCIHNRVCLTVRRSIFGFSIYFLGLWLNC